MIFPRLVWAHIYQYLSYRDRCHLRATCKWLAKMPNREPLDYWIKRDDEIVQLLGRAVYLHRARLGIRVPVKMGGKYSYSFSLMFHSYIFMGGNLENIIEHRLSGHYFYKAHKNGHKHVVDYFMKLYDEKKDCMRLPPSYVTKYYYSQGMFNVPDVTILYKYAIRFGAPREILEHCRLNRGSYDLINYVINEARKKNLKPLNAFLKKKARSYFLINSLMIKACKWKYIECIQILLEYVDFNTGEYFRGDDEKLLRKITSIGRPELIMNILQKFSHNHLTIIIRESVQAGIYYPVIFLLGLVLAERSSERKLNSKFQKNGKITD